MIRRRFGKRRLDDPVFTDGPIVARPEDLFELPPDAFAPIPEDLELPGSPADYTTGSDLRQCFTGPGHTSWFEQGSAAAFLLRVLQHHGAWSAVTNQSLAEAYRQYHLYCRPRMQAPDGSPDMATFQDAPLRFHMGLGDLIRRGLLDELSVLEAGADILWPNWDFLDLIEPTRLRR